jgi:N-ethylmaleimide reductase
MTATLFTPLTAGLIEMKNRIVMAPLTRCRAYGLKPGALHVDYYRQRAGAGLIVSEGAQISEMGQGNADTPGIYSAEQVAAWREVTEAVHKAGGKIVIQLWHVGRISHEKVLGGRQPVAPSAIAARAKARVDGASHETPVPRALSRDEIAATVNDYRRAAANARAAGFDGVEIHGANGYLIDQFLRDSSNRRDDDYGGAIANRVRFLREVVGAVADEIGPGRCGLRLSPWSNANDIGIDSDTPALFAAAIDALNATGIAFLHVVEGQTGGPRDFPVAQMAALRQRFNGVWIANNGYDRDSAIDAVENRRADAVAFGRDYISTPDLAERLEKSTPLNPRASQGVYGGGAEGFTDYPSMPK